ncbi:hypothetical protein BVY02_00625 [bacterium J17]|nr:hypothetical protein BVY02_00625 [bacterium J17]
MIVIGIGNVDRGDDGIGIEAARQLRNLAPEGVTVVEKRGETTELLAAWRGEGHVIAVDAIVSGKPAGTVHRFIANEKELSSDDFQCSTHGFGLREAVELARALGELPEELIIYGVEGKNFNSGGGLSEEAKQGVEEAVRQILVEMQDA